MLNPGGQDVRRSKKKTVAVSRVMFIGGFFLLPFLWIANFFYFRKILTHPDAPKEAKAYVVASLAMGVLAFACLLAWFLTYEIMWNSWGVFGETISLYYPR
eukprot:CAMPEP_0114622592 /NCGR_PEP_ID=MMETSP0168-20121206/9817_1 /TAXON_ID=95228 ORGANISM="Vannella sp., Strain DIVA3 517/6/12" /NCGR_SAMPLE_ID=MMETSP0168 /ASSEMBLY_ACC=CAM_ASM_000044 /LENGTH=100 /DNA_ID=CAMNT_0001833813 /DNA_START=73 /DNA_END=371 /DNA_ORIENTATION=-